MAYYEMWQSERKADLANTQGRTIEDVGRELMLYGAALARLAGMSEGDRDRWCKTDLTIRGVIGAA